MVCMQNNACITSYSVVESYLLLYKLIEIAAYPQALSIGPWYLYRVGAARSPVLRPIHRGNSL